MPQWRDVSVNLEQDVKKKYYLFILMQSVEKPKNKFFSKIR